MSLDMRIFKYILALPKGRIMKLNIRSIGVEGQV
jgi:hypothetical protein